MTEWSVEGIEFGNCNCIHGCPCQFEGQPTGGYCRGFEVLRIDRGHDTDDGATHWWVYHAMCDTVHPTLVCPIAYEVDLEARSARVSIPGVLESVGTPIRSPATGAEHRVRIDIPNGIEFELAEVGNASTTATGAIRLDLTDTYGQFNRLRHSGRGVVHA